MNCLIYYHKKINQIKFNKYICIYKIHSWRPDRLLLGQLDMAAQGHGC